MKVKAMRKRSPHEKISVSVLLKPFISGNEKWLTIYHISAHFGSLGLKVVWCLLSVIHSSCSTCSICKMILLFVIQSIEQMFSPNNYMHVVVVKSLLLFGLQKWSVFKYVVVEVDSLSCNCYFYCVFVVV